MARTAIPQFFPTCYPLRNRCTEQSVGSKALRDIIGDKFETPEGRLNKRCIEGLEGHSVEDGEYDNRAYSYCNGDGGVEASCLGIYRNEADRCSEAA